MPTLKEVEQKVNKQLGQLKMKKLDFSNYSNALDDYYDGCH